MARTKNYHRHPDGSSHLAVAEKLPSQRGLLVFADELPEGTRITRDTQSDLSGWLGHGVDAWVDSMIDGYRRMLHKGFSTQTVAAYAESFKAFLEFLVLDRAVPLVAEPSGLRALHVTQLVGWLRARSAERAWSVRTTHSKYSHIKRSLTQLLEMKVVPADARRFFPYRPFPNGTGLESHHGAFSEAEMSRLARAIKADLVDVHHGRLELRPAEAMAGRFLIVAMRTGSNATPLLELSRKSAKPGLLPGTKVIDVLKHRAHKAIALPLLARSKEEGILIPTDAAAVLERTLDETAQLAREAPPALKDRVWLFRSAGGTTYGEVSCMNLHVLAYAIKTMVKRRDLVADDGEPLHVNVSRLRKSFSKRAFRLTNGDLVTTANLLGNKPRVTESNYLNPDAEVLAEGANFIDAELTVRLRGDATSSKVIPILNASEGGRSSRKTPVSECNDTLYGEHAPKNGVNHCDNFVMCVFCSSFAVVGEFDELWRLFSFQRFAQIELDYLDASLGSDEQSFPHKQLLRKRYRVAIPFIDSFTVANFGAKLAGAAKDHSQTTLHPFWASQVKLAARSPANTPTERVTK